MELKEFVEEGKPKANKIIALKFSSKDIESEDDDDIFLLAKDFKKYLSSEKKAKERKRKHSSKEFNDDTHSELRCYHCDEVGHIKPNCPKYKKGKKALKATTWSDSDTSVTPRLINYRVISP